MEIADVVGVSHWERHIRILVTNSWKVTRLVLGKKE
jgi:hypothetical protein